MDWKNLSKMKCPKCAGKLVFRARNRTVNMKVRGGKQQSGDMYYCSKCWDFQIGRDKLNTLAGKV